jgi:Holliday junction resolvase
MGMISKRKGKTGELEVAALLREYGFEGKRGVQYQGGKDSADVTGLPGFHIEVKRTEKLNLEAAMAQARADCEDRTVNTPVVFHRKNKNDWVVILDVHAFLNRVKEYEKLRDMLVKSCERQVNLPVVVKDQPEDSDWEQLKAQYLAARKRVADLEDELENARDQPTNNWEDGF